VQGGNQQAWQLTWKGWQTVEPTSGTVKGLGFVAMSFHPEMNDAFENGIRPAIEEDCGLRAFRVDKEHFGEKICDRIMVEIKRAQFVVADCTRQSPGVYFEAGYGLALAKQVIWSCRKDEVEQKLLHFDTRQYPHAVWTDAADLRNQLGPMIKARISGAVL
jgi:nucleoside 2-deoxyribosyltransferase